MRSQRARWAFTSRGFTWLIDAKSVVTFPCPEKPLDGPRLYEIRGLAWTGNGKVRRVDVTTERKILDNVRRQYPGLTLLSVTQKIAPIEDYDQIVLLMEGEVLASGTHQELLATCPEYVQIHESQRSTSHYESVPA